MKNLFLFFLIFVSYGLEISAQVVTTIPEFPTDSEPVTIKFDASEGNKGLLNCNCDIYLHTGVLTPESANISDWRYVQGIWGQDIPELKMSRTGLNSFQFQIDNIRDFYGVPEEVEIVALTFVFRNVDGSIVGRSEAGGDIAIDLFTQGEVVLNVLNPSPNSLVNVGETLNFEVETNTTGSVVFTNTVSNEIIYQSERDSNYFAFDYVVPENQEGGQIIEIVLSNEETAISETFTFTYTVLAEQVIASLPANVVLGLNRAVNGSATFVLEAPGKELVLLDASFSEQWPGSKNVQMNKTPDGKYFWITIDGFQEGIWYNYRYIVDQNIIVADPYSELIIDVREDQFFPPITEDFPRITANSEAGPVDRLSTFKYEGFPYEWEVPDFQAPETEDLFIYELLIRDFIADHSYNTLIDTLDYLQRLGVNAIELMPVNEFEANISWGYNPSFHMALDKYYGGPLDFKRFVDEAHKRGMAVIIDIVLNHAFSQSPLAQLYWDAQAFRPSADNPWLNQEARHPFNVGYDFNHESQNTKDFVRRVTQFWFTEYHIDGYRYDLSKGFTQTLSTDDGVFRRYDQGRIDILQEMSDYVREVKPDAILILEHFGANNEEVELSNRGFLLWGNMHGAYKEGILGFNDNNKSNISGAYWKERNWTQPNLVSFMESHDEQRQLYDAQEFGNSNGSYNVRDLTTGLDRTALAHTFLWTIPGPKMIWQFGELGYDFPINYCEDGTIRDDCRTGIKPLRWDYLSNADRVDLYNHISDMAFLKKTYNMAFRQDPNFFSVAGATKQIEVLHSDLNFLAVGNFDVRTASPTVVFNRAGMYFDYFSDETLMIQTDGQQVQLNLQPGQGQLWLSEDVQRPSLTGGVTSTNDFTISNDLHFYPNPVKAGSTITIEMDNLGLENAQFRIFDTRGVEVWRQNIPDNPNGFTRLVVELPELSKGIYVMEISSNEARKAFVGKMVVE